MPHPLTLRLPSMAEGVLVRRRDPFSLLDLREFNLVVTANEGG